MKQMESKLNLLEVGLAGDVKNNNSKMCLSFLKILILISWNCSENIQREKQKINSYIFFGKKNRCASSVPFELLN